jgi:hypothetical protein
VIAERPDGLGFARHEDSKTGSHDVSNIFGVVSSCRRVVVGAKRPAGRFRIDAREVFA